MKKGIFLIIAFCTLFFHPAFGGECVLKGRVYYYDIHSKIETELDSVKITAVNEISKDTIISYTDDLGKYEFQNINSGNYSIKVDFFLCDPQILNNINVDTNFLTVQDIVFKDINYSNLNGVYYWSDFLFCGAISLNKNKFESVSIGDIRSKKSKGFFIIDITNKQLKFIHDNKKKNTETIKLQIKDNKIVGLKNDMNYFSRDTLTLEKFKQNFRKATR